VLIYRVCIAALALCPTWYAPTCLVLADAEQVLVLLFWMDGGVGRWLGGLCFLLMRIPLSPCGLGQPLMVLRGGVLGWEKYFQIEEISESSGEQALACVAIGANQMMC
jgi:hypothetical protein